MTMTPTETQVLADIEAAKARGDDPFGDNDQPEAETPEAETPAAIVEAVETAEVVAPEGQEPAPEPVPERASDQPASYKTDMPADYKAQRGELMKQKAGLTKQLMDGEIDADAFAAEEARISDSLEDLTAQRIRAETLQEANAQTQANYQQAAIQRLITSSKAEVDYTADAKAQKQFDIALTAIGQDLDNAGRDYVDLISEAHKVVLALRGITSKGQQVADAIKSRIPDGNPPVTLRGLPTASTPNSNGDMLDQIGRLKGPAYEEAYAKLSPSQKRALLDME